MKEKARTYYRKKLESLPNATVRTFERREVEIESIKRVHIVGVCGTAMASLAGLLTEAGYDVSGSDDNFYPPMSTLIESLSLKFYKGYAKHHLEDTNLIIIGNAIHADNSEAAHAREEALLQCSVAEALQIFFMKGKRSLVVSGTHGKTTTTGLLSHIFSFTKKDPSYLIGGAMQSSERSFRLGSGSHFISEGDEYDTAYFDKSPKFLHYRPSSAIMTSVEFDHADIFRDEEDYRLAFRFFSQELSPGSNLFVYGDDPVVASVAASSDARLIRYGLHEANDLTARNIVTTPNGQNFLLIKDGRELGEFFVPLLGDHNLLNTLAACGMSLAEGVSLRDLRQSLKGFPGMKRRQEVCGTVNDIIVIDDFAHHPTEVRETVRAIRRKYPDRRLVAVFEPRSNTSRRKIFEHDYGGSFDEADLAYVACSPALRSDIKDDSIDESSVVRLINERGTAAYFGGEVDSLLKDLTSLLTAGDAVLIMSNGDFGNIHKRLLEALGN